MSKRIVILSILIHLSFCGEGQNLVPNPSFENMNPCEVFNPELMCSQSWSDYLALDPTNTPDLGYEGAVFFPPSTINAFDGNQYLNIECSTGNPEYIQVQLMQPMVAGTTYCVSFYASHSQESPEVAPSLGAYFTNGPLLDSPFELGIDAHVQGPINFDPTSWTLITGNYTAMGGETIMVLGGFENTGTMPFPYMYIDMVSVLPMPALVLNGGDLCDGNIILDATAAGATYTWDTGETSASIEVSTAGTFTVARTIGTCTQEASAEITICPNDPIDDPVDDPIDDPEDPTDEPNEEPTDTATDDDVAMEMNFFAPNTITPDGDGLNDVFGIIGPTTDRFELQVFNRWGEVVFESNDINQRWIANHQGGNTYVSDGIYVYQFKAVEGVDIIEGRGHLLVIR